MYTICVGGGGGVSTQTGQPPDPEKCGINPVTGGRGINAANSGKHGELRPGDRGRGHFGARRVSEKTGRVYSHEGTDISASVKAVSSLLLLEP